MNLITRYHHELMAAFERDYKGRRLDLEDKSLWPKGIIYQDGHTNELFLAYRLGASYAKAVSGE